MYIGLLHYYEVVHYNVFIIIQLRVVYLTKWTDRFPSAHYFLYNLHVQNTYIIKCLDRFN